MITQRIRQAVTQTNYQLNYRIWRKSGQIPQPVKRGTKGEQKNLSGQKTRKMQDLSHFRPHMTNITPLWTNSNNFTPKVVSTNNQNDCFGTGKRLKPIPMQGIQIPQRFRGKTHFGLAPKNSKIWQKKEPKNTRFWNEKWQKCIWIIRQSVTFSDKVVTLTIFNKIPRITAQNCQKPLKYQSLEATGTPIELFFNNLAKPLAIVIFLCYHLEWIRIPFLMVSKTPKSSQM